MPKILIVEDNEMNRDMLSRRLQRKGFATIIAEDGEQGLRLAASEGPDAILMDISLPGRDGYDCTRALKTNPNTRNIPVIALTAHAMEGDRQRCLAAGCDEFETKPVNLSELLRKINELIAPHGSQD